MDRKLVNNIAFYALVTAIVLFSVFPFYYAVVTSFATGTALFEANYWPKHPEFGLCGFVHSGLRVIAGGDGILRLGAGAVSRPGPVVDDDFGGINVSADRRFGGPFRADQVLGTL
jgi:ABC-type glycerol-3-phosphate transport system permease component